MAWGIDVEDRRMKFQPWLLDDSGKHKVPSAYEIEATYGISGEAVAETLAYFKDRGGDEDRLVSLLNGHVIDPTYLITKEDLYDASRWYTNEYYFYFIMFTKKLIGRYDFHFGEGKNEQLSKYHRCYEKGFLRYVPYGQGDEDVSNAIPHAIYRMFIAKYPHFSDFLDWADIICLQKGVPSYKKSIFPIQDIWVNSEFIFFLYEIAKVLSNWNDMSEIIRTGFHLFHYSSITFIPQSLLPKILEKLADYTTTVYNTRVTRVQNTFKIEYWRKASFDRGKFYLYSISVLETVNKIIFAGFPLGLQRSLKMKAVPECRLLTPLDGEHVHFELRLENPMQFPRIALGALSILFWPLLALLFGEVLPATLPFLIGATAASFALSQFIPLYIRERRNAALYVEHNEKNTADKEKSIAELKALSVDLMAEKKNLEAKVKERTAEIEEANRKLRAYDKSKTDFFYNVSHELRTPLTLIRSPLEAVRRGHYGRSIPADSPVIDMALRNTDRLTEQVDMLLDFAKIDQKRIDPDWEVVDLSRLCSFFTAELQPRASMACLTLETSFPDRVLPARIDLKLFERAFFNLALNALKFTPRGGRVIIGLEEDDGRVLLHVQDTGIGIPADKIGSIFERFTQLEASSTRRFEGTGLGLALVKEVCGLLEADIKVESGVGRGSRFTMGFRKAEGTPVDLADRLGSRRAVAPLAIEQASVEPAPADGHRPTVLLVEDTADMRLFLRGFLERRYRVLEASNGQEAYGIYQAQGGVIDLVMTDIMMPLMDGRELYRKITADGQSRHLPFLFLTARASLEEKVEAMGEGAVDYIYKPFAVDEVLAKTEALLSLMDGQADKVRREMEERILGAIRGVTEAGTPEGKALESYGLTAREREVAERVLAGRRNKEIASELGLSEHTVAHHLESIYRKTGAGSRIEFLNAVKKD